MTYESQKELQRSSCLVFMVLSLLPSAVFAAAVSTLEGQVKINGNATPGTTLSADLNGVKPEGISEDSVSYVWSRKGGI